MGFSSHPRTQVERLWLAGGVLAVVVATLLAWFVIVSPKWADADDADARTDEARTANLTLNVRVQKLRTQSDALESVKAALHAARDALPTGADVEVFTTQLAAAAASAGVTVTSITAAAPVPVAGTGSPSGTGVSGASVAGQLFSIHIAVISDGAPAAQRQFLHDIQYGQRAALVTRVSVAASSDGPAGPAGPQHGAQARSTMTLELNVFVAPQSPEAELALQQQLAAGGG